MDNEIKVGEYVRTKDGVIAKVTYVDELMVDTGINILCNFDLNEMRWIPLEEIDVWYEIVTKKMMESISYKVTKM